MDEEVARTRKGIYDMDASVAEVFAEFFFQELADARDHEADDRGRRVNDAHRIGDFDREALEEFFVNGIQEFLLLGKILNDGGGTLDGDVEAVEFLEEVGAREMAGGERVDHLFDLDGDNVAAGEVGVVEDGAEKARGEQVLNKHLL